MAKVYIGSLLMVDGKQCRVIGKMTYADFMAMTGQTRDYVAETGNVHDLAALDAAPENTLLYYTDDWNPESIRVLPEKHIRYGSAKDKKATLKAQADDTARRQAEYAEKRRADRENVDLARQDRIAEMLYGFDRYNEAWENAQPSVRDTYLHRAAEVIAAY